MSTVDTCTLCPRLCRHACPVAAGTGREAAVPTLIADAVLAWRRGEADADLARAALALCVDCGRCESACHLHQPLPDALGEARHALGLATAAAALAAVEGEGEDVAVEARRPFAAALARVLGRPVARWGTADSLGAAGRGGPGWAAHLAGIRAALGGRRAVTADGDVARVLASAGVAWAWLHDVVDPGGADGLRSGCVGAPLAGALGCCGGGEALVAGAPDEARRLAARWVREGGPRVADVRCASHLRAQGYLVEDAVDRLLARAEGR